jgi:hypothetical protein
MVRYTSLKEFIAPGHAASLNAIRFSSRIARRFAFRFARLVGFESPDRLVVRVVAEAISSHFLFAIFLAMFMV